MSGAQGKIEELKKRVLFTLIMLGVYRVATQVPTLGVDSAALTSFFAGKEGTLFGVFNTFSGGALQRILSPGAWYHALYYEFDYFLTVYRCLFPALGELAKESEWT